MLDHFYQKSCVQTDRSRAVFILIALAGVLPSALVLWFTSLAIRNEQLATAKVEEETRHVLLNQIQSDLVKAWNTLLEKTDRRVTSLPPAVAFYESVTEGAADGLIVLTPNDTQRIAYPGLPRRAEDHNSPPASLAGLNTQLAAYFGVLTAAIQRNQKDKTERAARTILDNADFERCVDPSGRHALSSIELFMIENRNVFAESTYASVLSRLTTRLNNYRVDSIPASQRRFLMSRISELTSKPSISASLFPTMSAEFLSAQYLEMNGELLAGPYLNRSRIDGVWQQRLPSGNGIVLFGEQRTRKFFGDRLADMDNPLAALIQVEVVSDPKTPTNGSAEMPLGAAFPGWRLRFVEANAGTENSSLAGIYVALSVASVGLILLVLFVIASITLRRLALAQQKNTMVATVSHELKTPVSSIKLLVDTLLQDSVLKPDRVREYLNLISRENLRLSQVIENVLSFSRIERTKFRIEKQPLDISDLIREAVATFSQQAEIADRELIVEVAPDVPSYVGDAWALNRAILNLLDNAYKYSDSPRQIRISARVERQVEKSCLVISVSDTGIGIRETDLGKIFGQFYQADQRLSRNNEGCGLGLSIVKHIVDLHGGTVDVQSQLGKGSTFTVRLPLE